MVVLREVRRQQLDAGEVDRALFEHVEEDREPPCNPRDLDPVPGLPLGEVKDLEAVVVQARVARAQVDVAGVHLGEMGDHAGGGVTFPRSQ